MHGLNRFGLNHPNLSVELFDPVANIWTGQSINIPINPLTSQYPWLHVLPAQHPSTPKLFFSGHFDGVAGSSSRFARKYDVVNRTWEANAGAEQSLDRKNGTSVLLPLKDPAAGGDGGRILIVGGAQVQPDPQGADVITNTAQFYCVPPVLPATCGDTTEGWHSAPNMGEGYGRQYPSAVILPDGNVFINGGESASGSPPGACPPISTPVYDAHLYKPAPPPGSWTLLPANLAYQRPRQYHQTTILLPDGSVFIAGGDTDAFCNCAALGKMPPCPTAQIYQPGYFFRGARPVITPLAPAARTVGYNGEITLTINQPIGDNAKVVLIRASSMTHSFNFDQRSVELRFVGNPDPGATTFRVQAPSTVNVAPPGYYMLFVVKNSTTSPLPSAIGEFIRLSL